MFYQCRTIYGPYGPYGPICPGLSLIPTFAHLLECKLQEGRDSVFFTAVSLALGTVSAT